MSFNDRVIAQFRQNDGFVEGFGRDLVLLHTVGARSGEARVNPVLAIADGDGWLVIASAGGSPRHPAWYFNLLANPLVSVETPAEMVDVVATTLDGAEREAAWRAFVARSSAFESYVERAEGREFPIVRLSRR